MADPSAADAPAAAADTAPAPTPASASELPPHPPILLRVPKRYQEPTTSPSPAATWAAPSLEWLARTWTVTHSTLPMWRTAKNVRITYKPLPGGQLDDTVESEPTTRTLLPQPRTISGVDTADAHTAGAWRWRGKGLLRLVSSRWEVLGWGERGGECWVVTWFAASLFTPEGVDVYSDRRGGGSEGLVSEVLAALEGVGVQEVAGLCKREMRAVRIDD